MTTHDDARADEPRRNLPAEAGSSRGGRAARCCEANRRTYGRLRWRSDRQRRMSGLRRWHDRHRGRERRTGGEIQAIRAMRCSGLRRGDRMRTVGAGVIVRTVHACHVTCVPGMHPGVMKRCTVLRQHRTHAYGRAAGQLVQRLTDGVGEHRRQRVQQRRDEHDAPRGAPAQDASRPGTTVRHAGEYKGARRQAPVAFVATLRHLRHAMRGSHAAALRAWPAPSAPRRAAARWCVRTARNTRRRTGSNG